MSYDVTLPIQQRPVFPDLCPVCGLPGVDDALRLSGSRGVVGGPWTMLPGGKVEALVPAHKACVRSATWSRRWRSLIDWLLVITVVLAASFLVRLLLPQAGRGVRSTVVIGCALLALVARGVWAYLRPPAVDITVFARKMDYEFRRPDYADAFARANRRPSDDEV